MATALMNQPLEQNFVQTLVDYYVQPAWRENMLRAVAAAEAEVKAEAPLATTDV